MAQDYYAVLGVRRNARQEEILEAFSRLGQKYHPLVNSSPWALEQMERVAEAWEVLSDPRLRRSYDRNLRRARHGRTRWFLDVAVDNWQTLAIVALTLLTVTSLTLTFTRKSAGDDVAVNVAGENVTTNDAATITQAAANEPGTVAEVVEEATLESDAGLTAVEDAEVVTVEPPTVAPAAPPKPVVASIAKVQPTLAPAAKPKAPVVAPKPQSKPATSGLSGLKYPAPTLILPENGWTFRCSLTLALQWSMPGNVKLGANEWFLVETRQKGKEAWFGMADWTQETNAVLNPNRSKARCDVLWWPGPGGYEWRVRVVQGNKATHTITRVLSLPSAISFISYSQ